MAFLQCILLLGCLFFAQANGEDLWKVGAKIHFEEESGKDYIGTKQLNATTRQIIKELITISSDDCSHNAKICLKKEEGKIEITHFEEHSKPGIGEELHATLLYTRPRGFCDSETLQQNCSRLFSSCCSSPSIETVSERYEGIIDPNWKFQIGEISLVNNDKGPFCVIAELFFNGRNRLFVEDKPISAGLHITFLNYTDPALLSQEELKGLLRRLNEAFQGQQIKIASKNGRADLECGLSVSSGRWRGGEWSPM